MAADQQLDLLTTAWRSRHGPEVQRRRATVVVETLTIAFEDGRLAELSRKAGDALYSVTRDPDAVTPIPDLNLPPQVKADIFRT